MRKFVVFLITFSVLSYRAKSQCTLKVEIATRNNNGVVLLELFDKGHKTLSGKKEIIHDKKCVIMFDNLKPARYAVRYFHDENSNDKLDTNWMGLPSEGYGFSNNAYGSFGPQGFEKWLVDVKGDTKISLKPKY